MTDRQDWLHEPDAPQNGKGLLFEFSFGQLNATKGQKRLLSLESIFTASNIKITRPKSWSTKDRLELAEECRQKLDACPAITRKGLASQLGMTTTRLNQILSLLKLAPEIRLEILTMEPNERVRLSDRALLRLLDIGDPAIQAEQFREILAPSGRVQIRARTPDDSI